MGTKQATAERDGAQSQCGHAVSGVLGAGEPSQRVWPEAEAGSQGLTQGLVSCCLLSLQQRNMATSVKEETSIPCPHTCIN